MQDYSKTDSNNNLTTKGSIRNQLTVQADPFFIAYFTAKNEAKPEIHGGFALAHWAGGAAELQKLKELKVTARCLPVEGPYQIMETGRCILTGRPSAQRIVFAKSY